jgi:hypothetical protein
MIRDTLREVLVFDAEGNPVEDFKLAILCDDEFVPNGMIEEPLNCESLLAALRYVRDKFPGGWNVVDGEVKPRMDNRKHTDLFYDPNHWD